MPVIVDVVRWLQVVGVAVVLQVGAEAVPGKGLQGIVLTPQPVHRVQILGGYFIIRLQPDIPLRSHELHNVVSITYSQFHILFCPGADCEFVVPRDQPPQPLQTPEEYTLLLSDQLFRQVWVIYPILFLTPCGQDDLTAEKPVTAVVKGFQGSVAEAKETDIKVALITLLSFLFQIQRRSA